MSVASPFRARAGAGRRRGRACRARSRLARDRPARGRNPPCADPEPRVGASPRPTARAASFTGTLSLKRPGRIRFEYGRGANMLLVGNGKTLNFIDYEVGQKSSWPVAKSPLAVLLSANPELGRIARIVPSNDPRVVVVRARDARRPEFGTLVLAFTRSAGLAGGPEARRLDRDRRPEQDDQGPPQRPALQCRGRRKRVHLRRTEAETLIFGPESQRVKRGDRERAVSRHLIADGPRGFPLLPSARRSPCVTNAWLALAPCPRSEGLFLAAGGGSKKGPPFVRAPTRR